MNDTTPAIIVKDIHKSFKLPHEQSSGIKQLVINFAKRSKGYETQRALSDVSFEVKKGEFFGIVGRNGSGKSTLLKLLAGIYAPDEGLIQVNGSLTPFIELGVGFNPELTGRENVFLNGALLGFSHKEMDVMYHDIVDFAELEKFMDQKLKNYSSGMQVRLAFSIAIRARSDILLLDEVLAVGDAAFQQKCFDYFENLRSSGQTVIFISHDMGAVKRFCTRALYLKDSKVIKEGSPEEVANIYIVDNLRDTAANQDIGSDDDNTHSRDHGVRLISIDKKPDQHKTNVKIGFDSNSKENKYIGISLMKDGHSIAEISTIETLTLKDKGTATYTIDHSLLNGGIYQLGGITLFKKDNREVLAIDPSRYDFAVEGSDEMRGGALRLADTWSHED